MSVTETKLTEPKTICVDFDQTLCDSNYPDVGKPKKGALKAMRQLKKMGFVIIVSSCRSCGWNWDLYYGNSKFVPAPDRPVYRAMLQWLHRYKVPFDIVDDGTKGKVSASYYLDDKAIRVEDNWPDVVATIKRIEKGKK